MPADTQDEGDVLDVLDDEPIEAAKPAPPASRVVKRPRPAARPDLPIERYQHLTIGEVVKKARTLPTYDLRQLREFEATSRKRKTLLAKLDRMLDAHPERAGSRDRRRSR